MKSIARLLYPSGDLDFAAGTEAWAGQLRTTDAVAQMKKREELVVRKLKNTGFGAAEIAQVRRVQPE